MRGESSRCASGSPRAQREQTMERDSEREDFDMVLLVLSRPLLVSVFLIVVTVLNRERERCSHTNHIHIAHAHETACSPRRAKLREKQKVLRS